MNYDFSGWASKNDIKCSDGVTIRENAFADQDGKQVPLVWQHMHDGPENIIGHAVLENRPEGLYTYCKFNDTEKGQISKDLVKNKDLTSLSIWANRLIKEGSDILHGVVREVSLVISGANPGANIDFPILQHSDGEQPDNVIIYSGEEIQHSGKENEEKKGDEMAKDPKDENKKKDDEKTIGDVLDELTEEQKEVVMYLIGKAIDEVEDEDDDNKDEGEEMKHSAFDNEYVEKDYISHDDMQAFLKDAKREGSMREAFIAHGDDYGIKDINFLFPDAKTVTEAPEFIARKMGWVGEVINSVHHTPFSRIKSVLANITEDEARARGYMKGKLKKHEVFTLLKRSTDPQTIYKKQKIDRDDMIDITDFDVVAWIKSEMRMMLDEEIARAVFVGDGRLTSDDAHIKFDHIRPIAFDSELYNIKVEIDTKGNSSEDAEMFVDAVIKSRKDYRGSGSPALFISEDMLADILLMKDKMGRYMYQSEEQLATTLRVSKIITVPIFNRAKDESGKEHDVFAIIVNLNDYNIGADSGGAVSMFDDFDIDYNQNKYLIETRCSGALTKPKSAITIMKKSA